MLLWYAAFRPGIMSGDSLSVWEQATLGGWVDVHPPAYTTGMWLSAKLIDSPSLLTLGQSLFLAASLVAAARALIRAGVPDRVAVVATGALAATPMVGAFSVSLWKDIPYSAAFLFMGARLIDLSFALYRRHDQEADQALAKLFGWSLVAVVFRQNGVLLIGALGVGLLVLLRNRRALVIAGIAANVLLVLVLKTAVYPTIDVQPTPSQGTLGMFMHDVAAATVKDPGGFDAEDRALIEQVAPIADWQAGFSAYGCENANWEFGQQFHWDRTKGKESEYVGLWRELLVDHPILVLENRLCVGSVGWRPDPVGSLYTVSRGIDPNSYGLETKPLWTPLRDTGRDVLDQLDKPGVQWLVWRAPVWIYLCYAAVGITAWQLRRATLLLPLMLLLALQITVTPLNPAQDARYMMPGLMLAVLLLTLVTSRSPDSR